MFGRLATFVLRHRGSCAAVFAAVMLLSCVGLSRLRVELSSRAFYGDGDAATAALDAYSARWGHDDATAIVVAWAADGSDVLTAARLDAVRSLADALRDSPAVARVDAVTDHPASAAVAGGSQAARGWLHQAPLVPLLLSATDRWTAVTVELAFSSDDLPQTTRALAEIDEIVRAHQDAAGLRWSIGGLPAVRAAFAAATVSDQVVLVPACVLMLVALLALAFRRAYQVFVPLVLAAVPAAMTLGLMGWFGEPLGLLSQGYLLLLPIIAVTDGIHLVARTGELAREAEAETPPAQIIVDACARSGLACLLTSVTTAAGFASLLGSDMPMLRSFGLWAAVGVMLAWLVFVVLGPLLLSRVRDLGPASNRDRAGDRLARWTGPARTRAGLVLVIALAVGAVAVWWSGGVPVDNRLSDLLDDDHPVAQTSATIDAQLGGVLSVELELEGAAGHWDQPHAVRTLAEFERWAATQPSVRVVLGPATLLAASGAAPSTDVETQRRAWRLLDELGLRGAVLDDDAQIARVSIRVPDLGGRAFAQLEQELVAGAREQFDLEVRSTGTTALAYHGVNRIATQLRSSLLTALVVITCALGIALASLRLALISVLPNLLPLAIGYAAVGVVQGHFDPLGGVVLALALGIAVDDTIHIIVRAREAFAAGLERDAALTVAMAKAGMPCTVTSVALAAGLALFGLSSFPPLRLLGTLGATVIVVAWVADLWVLPALMALGWRPRR